jgi:hypothetical protein
VELPDPKAFSHAYHHPERIRPDHLWVDWFVEFDRSSPGETKGLEFKEGLWAEKLLIVAVLCTITIITVSVVWCALGGDLQTVFTVMGFVLSLIAGELTPASLMFWTICAFVNPTKLKLRWRRFIIKSRCPTEGLVVRLGREILTRTCMWLLGGRLPVLLLLRL